MLSVRFPLQYWGAYFYADLCGGWIRARHPDGTVLELASGISQPVDLAFDSDDTLYYLARGGGATTGVVYRISHDATPSVTLTANGSMAAIVVSSDDPLQLQFAFDAGSDPLDTAEIYLGLLAPFGVFWLDPSQGFVTTLTRIYAGPLPSFGPAPLVQLPTAGVLPPGPYWWVIFVDRDEDGALDGDITAIVLTVIEEP
jgi:hypothetical protein